MDGVSGAVRRHGRRRPSRRRLDRQGCRLGWLTFSKLQATVRAWFPRRRSHAMATQSLPTIAMQEPCSA